MRLRPWFVGAIALALASLWACVDHPDIRFRRFEVVSVSPTDAETGVDLSQTITVAFSLPVAVDSITATSFAVSVGGQPLAGTFLVQGTSATFTPATPLRYLTDYQVSLSGEIHSVTGFNLKPTAWTFSTRDLTWGPVAVLTTNTQVLFFAGAQAPSNRPFVVWTQDAGRELVVDRGDNDGWLTNQVLRTGTAQDTVLTTAASAWSSTSALAVWSATSSSSRYDLYASTFQPSSGWSIPKLIENVDTGNATSARVFSTSRGESFVTWSESNGTHDDIYASHFSPGLGWSPQKLVESYSAGNDVSPVVVATSSGLPIVAWLQVHGPYEVASAEYDQVLGWGIPPSYGVLVETTGQTNSNDFPALSIDVNDRAGCAWAQNTVVAAAFSDAISSPETWSPPVQLNYGTPSPLEVTSAAGGDVTLVAWNTASELWAASYTPSSGWSAPVELDSGAAISTPAVAVDARGNGFLAWARGNGTAPMWDVRFTESGGWSSPTTVHTPSPGFGDAEPLLAMAPDGYATLFWITASGTTTDILLAARLE